MVVLLEFSEEVLNLIISRLADDIDPLANRESRPASNRFEDTSSYMHSISGHPKTQIRNLHALPLTCRVFRRLVVPFLYLHVNVLKMNSLCNLMRTIKKDESYQRYIKVATVIGIDEALDFFFLPKIVEIHMYDLRQWDLEGLSRNQLGQSPVTVMRLVDSGLESHSLILLLSLPSALEELWYEVGRLSWRFSPDIPNLVDTINDLFPGALKYQTAHLRKFTLTMCSEHNSGYPGTRIDLCQFQTLKHLRIDEIFLTFSEHDEVSMSLPKCLEVLEVVNEEKSCRFFYFWGFGQHLESVLSWICAGNSREGLRLKKVVYENCGTGFGGCDYDFAKDTFYANPRKDLMANLKETFQENGMELTVRLNCYKPYCSER